MRKRLMLAVVALSLLFITPVDAQTSLDRARQDVEAATDRLEGFLNDLEATQRRGDALAAQYWQVQSGVEKLDLDIAASQAITAELAEQRETLRDEVRVIAVNQYVSRSEDIGVGDYATEADRAAAETLARLVVGADLSALDQLAVVDAEHETAQASLLAQREEQAVELAQVEATQAALVAELARLADLRAALDAELVELERALADLEAAEAQRQAEADEQARIAEERQRAQAALQAAAERARQIPTPVPVPTAAPTPLPQPTATPTATAVPNPQPSEPFPTATPLPGATAVPNPQPSEPFPTATPVPGATAVPNPQPSQPLATAVPNPQPSQPFPTATPAATAVPNPQPSTPLAPSTGGGITCPLSGPFTHTDDFSAPRAVGGIHRANDLIAAQGTPVLAAAAGTIEHRDSRVGGLSAHLKGDNGDYYFYTHLSGYENVGAGRVPAGAVIGYVGMTGNAPIPHLHFEIHKGGYGNYSNPYGPVRAACF